jgi:cell pole-organizing protein PopZ
MKTTVIGNDKAKNNQSLKTDIRPSLTGKEAKDEASNKDTAKTPQGEETKASEAKTDSAPTVDNQPANVAEAPKAEELKPGEEAKPQAEPTKKELKESFAQQAMRSLDQTVSIVLALGNKIKQRDKYRFNIDTLNAFKINQVDEDEDTGNTSYQRCELTITDDQGNEYTTKNPLVIAATVEFMSNRFMERLAEIEAEIVIPV